MTKSSRDSASSDSSSSSNSVSQIVDTHAHVVQRLAEILIAAHGPAHLQQPFLVVELDAGLFLVDAAGTIGQGARAGIFPQRAQRFLQLLVGRVGAQQHLAVHMDFKRSVVIRHVLVWDELGRTCHAAPSDTIDVNAMHAGMAITVCPSLAIQASSPGPVEGILARYALRQGLGSTWPHAPGAGR
jgi:hypothetical protein